MLQYPEEPSDKPTDISLHHEPSEERSDMSHLETQYTPISSNPNSPFEYNILEHPDELSDQPTDICLHHEPSEEPCEMPHLESQFTTISSTPNSPFVSNMSPPLAPTAVKQRRHIIVLLIPLLFLLILKQYEVLEYNDHRSLLWSTNAKNRRKKKRVLWT